MVTQKQLDIGLGLVAAFRVIHTETFIRQYMALTNESREDATDTLQTLYKEGAVAIELMEHGEVVSYVHHDLRRP